MIKRSGVLPGCLLLVGFVSGACGSLPVAAGSPTEPPTPTEPAVLLSTPSSQSAPDAALEAVSLSPAATAEGYAPPRPTPLQFVFPTTGPSPVSAWRPPPYPVPWALRPEDHFFFARPIPSGEVNWPHPRYRYGSTFFGEESTHTGVDLGAGRGTPVLAAGPGEVVWTGYGLYRGVYDPTDPYGLAVAIRHDFGYQGQPLFTVYAHLETSVVWIGQRVQAREVIGTVGESGHADGAHLHFEVRQGENRYFSTRNPELWMAPPEGWGVLAGRVLDTLGRPLPERLVQIRSLETGQRWDVWTYALETVRPDDRYAENFVIGDLPSGPYEVTINHVGRNFTAALFVHPGQTNFLIFRGRDGFAFEPTPTPGEPAKPPTP
jgi:murein DD-endopeptidase MepM/ murein hydrolase activator NlpD